MLKPDQIPDEVVEAAARAICAGNKWGEPCAEPCTDCVPEARASIAAAINAWPRMRVDDTYRWLSDVAIILPLEGRT